ncbi:MAG: dihydroorotase [Cyclobacteriaceae bacterium]
MKGFVIKGATVVNEGKAEVKDVVIDQSRIQKIGSELSVEGNYEEVNADGLHLFPGVIDDQVHFREPGLTHKGEIYTEAKAAVAGGVTSYMEMPNVNPQTLTQSLLQSKYDLGREKSLANYSFYMGASNDNQDEVLKTNPKDVCGIKVFMGSSTGNMLVDKEEVLETIFKNAPILVATHCEDEATIQRNLAVAKERFGDNIPFDQHPVIRSEEACYLSSSKAVELAQKHDTRLHILHISTGKETHLFQNNIPLSQKRITSEACIHHLWFDDSRYADKGAFIKWNPAVKSKADQDEIWRALLDDRIDVIATDHAPHTLKEKNGNYLTAPSGGPLVQHSLVAMLDCYQQGKISLERIADKMCHAVAECFEIQDRGYIREGYFADMVLVDLNKPWTVKRENIVAKCGWSPFEGHEFGSSIHRTFVSGHLAYDQGVFDESKKGERMTFNR